MKAHFMVEPMGRMAEARRRGFTLIELLVSLLIIGIVVATVAPAVGRSMAQTRVQRASASMAADIQRAFSLAAQRRSPVRISVDTANKTFFVRNLARDTMYVTSVYNSTSDMGLTRLQASDTTIVVFPIGLSSKALTITMHATTASKRQIAATRAGQVRITTP